MVKSLNPLIVSILRPDIENDLLINELAYLRSYLRYPNQADVNAKRLTVYQDLGLENQSWDDLVVLGPDGQAISLPKDQEGYTEEIDNKVDCTIAYCCQLKHNYLWKVIRDARVRIAKSEPLEKFRATKAMVKTERESKDYSFLRGGKEVERMYKKRLKDTLLRLKVK